MLYLETFLAVFAVTVYRDLKNVSFPEDLLEISLLIIRGFSLSFINVKLKSEF